MTRRPRKARKNGTFDWDSFFGGEGAAAPKPVKPVPPRPSKPKPKPPTPPPRPTPPRSRRGPPSGVMLAKAWKGSDPRGWWMSEKLDGMRAYWTGDALYTRNGNKIAAPTWFIAVLPQGIALDGEIYMGRGRFSETVSVTRKATARDPRWREVCYMAFDAPEIPGGCEQRFQALQRIVRDACMDWSRPGRCPLVYVEQKVCKTREDLTRFHEQIDRLRGEGVMLRAPRSRYMNKRTSDLLKVKKFMDAEAVITGYTEGTGRNEGRLGAYTAKLVGSGVRFKVGSGLSDYERDYPKEVGTVITVKFQELTKAGVPRFPSLVGARDYE